MRWFIIRLSLVSASLWVAMAQSGSAIQREGRAGSAAQSVAPARVGPIVVSANGRFLQHQDGAPFFWLGDTAWLLFQRLDRAETEQYLENRRLKGFTVIQAVALRGATAGSSYGAALIDGNPERLNVTPGNDPSKPGEYDYWDHIDWVVDLAAHKGLYMAILPTWGNVVNSGVLNAQNAAGYARWLGQRYRDKPNIFWINGGDTRGDQQADVWRAMGRTLKEVDPGHLISFHPFGRTQSSLWFHNDSWLDFNMFQSGHKRYDQDTEPGAKGEDNWRYVREDYARIPPKPTFDPNYAQGGHAERQSRSVDGLQS